MATLTPTSTQAVRPLSRRSAWAAFKVEYWLGLILVGHVVLAVWYSLAVPPWEAHDEWAHFRYAAYIAEEKRLPDPGVRLTTEFEFDEATQPPLYYLAAAIPMLVVDTKDGYRPTVNPYASRGTGEGGVNMVLNDPLLDRWPYGGTLLAIRLGRLVSVVMSTVGLYFTYRMARLLSPGADGVVLAAVALQAFAPQYVFLSAVMTNDILLIALETALLYFLLRLVRDGFAVRTVLAIGLTLVLALLTKYLAIAMLPVVLLAMVLAGWKHGWRPRSRWGWVGWAALATPLVLAGIWWLGRNVALTGRLLPRDPTSQANLLGGITGSRALALDPKALAATLRYGFETYWVSFGWGNVGAADWVYAIWLAVVAGGLIGLLLWLRRPDARRRGSLLLVCLAYVIAVVSLPLLREILHATNLLRGRYILSSLPLVAWVIAQGWAQLSGRTWFITQKLLIAWPLLLTLALVPLVLVPAYALPPTVLEVEAPGQPVDANFGGKARLLRMDTWPADKVTPGQGLSVTLTWEVLDRTDVPYTVAVHLLGTGDQSYGSATSYPGNGRAATTIWRPGSTFSETYWLSIRPDGPTPTQGRVKVALFHNSDPPSYLPVSDANGSPQGDALYFGDLRIDAVPNLTSSVNIPPTLASFGDLVHLSSARFPLQPQRPGWAIPVALRWQALGPSSEPIQVTVQMLDAKGNWVAGSDGNPDNNLPTHLWQAGDRINTVRWLEVPADLAPGSYRLIVALYRPNDLVRLPAVDAAGQRLSNDAVPLGEITVQAP